MNIPNIISLVRVALVPVFVFVFFSDTPDAHRNAGLIFILASATDALDGFIARKFNMITRLGRILDPLADKLMTFAALICITIVGIVPAFVIAIFFAKELLMAIGALLMYKRIDDVLPSNMLGKVATVTFFIFCVILMIFEVPRPVSTLMMTAALLLTLLALIIYTVRFFKTVKKKDKAA